MRVKYGVDDDVCNGDHACIRLSGCPTLTLKDNPDPLKVDPVAHRDRRLRRLRAVRRERAHAATLCPTLLPRRGGAATRAGTSGCWRSLRGATLRALQPA